MNGWFGVITEIQEDCTTGDAEAVVIGKKYPLQLDAICCIFFIDEDGDKNYGCNCVESSSYKFYRTED